MLQNKIILSIPHANQGGGGGGGGGGVGGGVDVKYTGIK